MEREREREKDGRGARQRRCAGWGWTGEGRSGEGRPRTQGKGQETYVREERTERKVGWAKEDRDGEKPYLGGKEVRAEWGGDGGGAARYRTEARGR